MTLIINDNENKVYSLEMCSDSNDKGLDFIYSEFTKEDGGRLRIEAFKPIGENFYSEENIKVIGDISNSKEDIADQLNEYLEDWE
jgi:hypothetical protein